MLQQAEELTTSPQHAPGKAERLAGPRQDRTSPLRASVDSAILRLQTTRSTRTPPPSEDAAKLVLGGNCAYAWAGHDQSRFQFGIVIELGLAHPPMSEMSAADPPSSVDLRRGPAGAPPKIEPMIAADVLMGGRREIVIVHDGSIYRLRITSNNKLILTK